MGLKKLSRVFLFSALGVLAFGGIMEKITLHFFFFVYFLKKGGNARKIRVYGG